MGQLFRYYWRLCESFFHLRLTIQFEDDEYFYYVKAVPKVTVTAPEKTVKRINERQETSRMDELKQEKILKNQTDEMLLTKALQEELEIQELLEEELKH